MKVGIQLPEVERDVRWPEYLAMAQAAEEVGFDSIWLGDHLLYRSRPTLYSGAAIERSERGPWEAWTLLSALAASTERVRLGPLVACLQFHPPGLIAKMAQTIDEVSAGRFVCSVGAGWNTDEFSAFGITFDHRVGRFEDAFTIVRGLLAGERVTHHGRFHHVQDAVLLPPPQRQIPIMIGSNGPRMLSIALPHADAWNTWYSDYGNTAEGFSALNARITAACSDAGRDPATLTRSACAFVLLDPAAPERPVTDEAPPIESGLAERLKELEDAGADEVILVVSPITERSIRILGEQLALTG